MIEFKDSDLYVLLVLCEPSRAAETGYPFTVLNLSEENGPYKGWCRFSLNGSQHGYLSQWVTQHAFAFHLATPDELKAFGRFRAVTRDDL